MTSSFIMTKPEERESKNFSGKLPFRTQPEVHESIFLASKRAGKSINAWMEEVLREAAKVGPNNGSEITRPPSQSLQRLFQEQPDLVFELIDNIKPALKSHKTRDTVLLMGEIEKLVENYAVVQSQIKSNVSDGTMETLESIFEQIETPDSIEGVTNCITSIDSVLLPRLQQPNLDNLLNCTQAIGQVLISVASVRLYLKNPSIENTLTITRQVIQHVFS
jgi:hypothetical protein